MDTIEERGMDADLHSIKPNAVVSLPGLYGCRFDRFGSCYGLVVIGEEDGSGSVAKIYRDGKMVVELLSDYGKVKTVKMAFSALHNLIFNVERWRRQTEKRRAANDDLN